MMGICLFADTARLIYSIDFNQVSGGLGWSGFPLIWSGFWLGWSAFT